jgi:excisionase family DNA binding protein
MKRKSNEKLCLTILETAKLLGIGKNRAYRAVDAGEIPSIAIGKRLVVPVAALEALLRGQADAR